jgi:hypothetical protein
MSSDTGSSVTSQMVVDAPRQLTLSAVLILYLLGMLSFLLIFAGIIVACLLKFEAIPLLLVAVALAVLFPPLCFENLYVRRLVGRLATNDAKPTDGFIVQLTVSPRLRQGLRSNLDDADDIGYLSLTPNELLYKGDSVRLSIPISNIKKIQSQNIGWRGLYLYGRRTTIIPTGLENVDSLEFTDRSSCILPASRRNSTRLYQRLCALTRT